MQRIVLKLEMPESFDDVAVEFSDVEWKMLSEQAKELHREVMVQNYENMVSLGYDIPVENLNLLLKKIYTVPSGDTNGGGNIQQTESSEDTNYISRNTDFSKIQSRQSSRGKSLHSKCEKAFPDIMSSTGHGVVHTGSQQYNCVDSKEVNNKIESKILLETNDKFLQTNGGEMPCKLINCSKQITFRSNRLTDQSCDSVKREINGLVKEEQLISGVDAKHDTDSVDNNSSVDHPVSHSGQKLHTCATCGKMFKQRCAMNSHRLVHTGEKPFRCITCNIGFVYKTSLTRHHKCIHAEQKQFKCIACGKGFNYKEGLAKHQRCMKDQLHIKLIYGETFAQKSIMLEPADKNKLFPCPKCGKWFTKKSTVESHLLIHTGEKPFRCATCGIGFIYKSSLKKHHQVTHLGVKPYKCTTCGKSFMNKYNFLRHEGTKVEKSICESIRRKRLSQKLSLIKPPEKKNPPSEQKFYPCATCGKNFKHKCIMETHRLVHTGDRPFRCTTCDIGFVYKTSLTRHNKILHTEQSLFQCTTCGKSFRYKVTFERHQVTHVDQDPLNSICDKKCAQQGSTINHQFVHTPNECSMFDKGSILKSSLEMHNTNHTGEQSCERNTFVNEASHVACESIHTNQKPYTCTTCNKGFTRKNSLAAHASTHSGQHSWPPHTRRKVCKNS